MVRPEFNLVDESKAPPIFERPETPRGKYKRLLRKTAEELLSNPGEWQQLQILHRKFQGEKEAQTLKSQEEQKERMQRCIKARQEWCTGSDTERFLKFLKDILIEKQTLFGGLGSGSQRHWEEVQFPQLKALISEYKLEKFFKKLCKIV